MSDRPMRQKQSVSQIVLFVHNQTTIVKICLTLKNVE